MIQTRSATLISSHRACATSLFLLEMVREAVQAGQPVALRPQVAPDVWQRFQFGQRAEAGGLLAVVRRPHTRRVLDKLHG
jgi:hypothetical protein